MKIFAWTVLISYIFLIVVGLMETTRVEGIKQADKSLFWTIISGVIVAFCSIVLWN